MGLAQMRVFTSESDTKVIDMLLVLARCKGEACATADQSSGWPTPVFGGSLGYDRDKIATDVCYPYGLPDVGLRNVICEQFEEAYITRVTAIRSSGMVVAPTSLSIELSAMVRRGRPSIDREPTRSMTLVVPMSLYRALEARARVDQVPMSEIIRRALAAYLF